MDQKKLDRISELTRLARQRALTEEETVERAALRQEYICLLYTSSTDSRSSEPSSKTAIWFRFR